MSSSEHEVSDLDLAEFAEFSEFVEELKNESDRAAVILGAAKLDLLLYHLLQKVLLPSTSKSDELLDGDSPLGTFSAKIALAYRLGLIDPMLCKTLHLVRRIRNSFAHELSGVSLKSGAHRDRVRELFSPLEGSDSAEWLFERYFANDKSPRNQFRYVVALVSARLQGAYDHATPRPTTPMGLVPPPFPESLKEPKKEAPEAAS
ncbi:MAG: hypothetical protein J0I00_16190 [Burkholderiales bacterium]|nr:hypothetical protein [Burkholderiales bacterium]